MHDIAGEGITLVEDLNKKREPLPSMEAIYLITPCDNSVRGIMNDFPSASRAKYKCCHVYFTEACAEELFNDLCKHPVSKFIKTLKEINIAFLPYESQVFSLDNREAFQYYFNPHKVRPLFYKFSRCHPFFVSWSSSLGLLNQLRLMISLVTAYWSLIIFLSLAVARRWLSSSR